MADSSSGADAGTSIINSSSTASEVAPSDGPTSMEDEGLRWEQRADAYMAQLTASPTTAATPAASGGSVLICTRVRPLLDHEVSKVGLRIPGTISRLSSHT